MKKLFIILAATIALALSACSGGNDTEELSTPAPDPTVAPEIEESVTGEQTNIETEEVADTELSSKIKEVNSGAVVTESVNVGLKMLSVNLPIETSDSLPEEFLSQVEKIVETSGIADAGDYDFYYFSVGTPNNVIVCVTFNKADGGIVLDKLTAVDKSYEAGLAAAAEGKELFQKSGQ